jgi:hypothetical protein
VVRGHQGREDEVRVAAAVPVLDSGLEYLESRSALGPTPHQAGLPSDRAGVEASDGLSGDPVTAGEQLT